MDTENALVRLTALIIVFAEVGRRCTGEQGSKTITGMTRLSLTYTGQAGASTDLKAIDSEQV